MEERKPYGTIIKYYRKRYGYTQAELARIMGISVPTLRNYEHGISVPDSAFMARFSLHFDVSSEIMVKVYFEEAENLFEGGVKVDEEEKKRIMREFREKYV